MGVSSTLNRPKNSPGKVFIGDQHDKLNWRLLLLPTITWSRCSISWRSRMTTSHWPRPTNSSRDSERRALISVSAPRIGCVLPMCCHVLPCVAMCRSCRAIIATETATHRPKQQTRLPQLLGGAWYFWVKLDSWLKINDWNCVWIVWWRLLYKLDGMEE